MQRGDFALGRLAGDALVIQHIGPTAGRLWQHNQCRILPARRYGLGLFGQVGRMNIRPVFGCLRERAQDRRSVYAHKKALIETPQNIATRKSLRDNSPFETAPQDNLETLRLVEDCYRLSGWEALP